MSILPSTWRTAVAALCFGAAAPAAADEAPGVSQIEFVQYVEPAPGTAEPLPPQSAPVLAEPAPPAVDGAPVATDAVETSAVETSGCDYCMPRHHGVGSRMSNYWHTRLKPCLQYTHWGYAENFVPRPLGASVYEPLQAQVTAGREAQMILYRYDFKEGIDGPPEQLNAAGMRRLYKLGPWLAETPLPLLVERTPGHPDLDEARRVAVADALSNVLMIPTPVERVVVVDPAYRGLNGDEALEVYLNQLEQTNNAAAPLLIEQGFTPGGAGGQ